MKYLLFTITIGITFTFAEVTAKAPRPSLPSNPITKPIERPSYDRLGRDDYAYNPYYNDIEIAQEKKLAEKKEKIVILEKELNATRRAEQKELQKKNQAEYNKEMKKFDNRKSSVQTENSIIVSDKPIK